MPQIAHTQPAPVTFRKSVRLGPLATVDDAVACPAPIQNQSLFSIGVSPRGGLLRKGEGKEQLTKLLKRTRQILVSSSFQ